MVRITFAGWSAAFFSPWIRNTQRAIEVLEPSEQPSLIRVHRKTVDLDCMGPDLAFGTMDPNDGFAVDQFAAESAPA